MADVLSPEQAALLAAFLRKQAGRPFQWGTADCGLFLADWVSLARGIADPAAMLRGTYDTQESCEAAIGGMPFADVVAGLAERAGLEGTMQPHDGDIGVVEVKGAATGAIMSQASWAFRTRAGITWTRRPLGSLIAAWRVF